MVLREGYLRPVNNVSTDKYISSVPGCLTHIKGKDTTTNGGTVFVYHSYSYIHIKNQFGLTAGNILWYKKAFYQRADQFGVNFKVFIAYNVPFYSA